MTVNPQAESSMNSGPLRGFSLAAENGGMAALNPAVRRARL